MRPVRGGDRPLAGARRGNNPALLAALLPLLPTDAFAHASERGHVLILPTGYYLVGGALAVAASFAVLGLLRGHALERAYAARLPVGRLGDGGRLAASLLSFAFLAALVAAGFFGSRDPLSNPLPLTVWTLLWVGLTLVQGLFGNLWRWIDPWYGPWRLALRLAGRDAAAAPLAMPAWLSMWPALFLLLCFAWFELIYPAPDDPEKLALAVGLYWLVSFAATLAFGHAEWSRRGEFLSVFFAMVSRFGIVERTPLPDGKSRLALCLPGAKLAGTAPLPLSGTLFLLAALGSVSFDGFSKTFFWLGANGINPLDYPGRTAMTGINGFGLLAASALLTAAYLVSVAAGEALARGRQRGLAATAGLLVWSIVPIALAYHFAHYLTALLVNGQYALVALSDPFARGWNLFGTAWWPVEAALATGSAAAWTIWNLQATAIIGGHVLAVLAAHRLAFRLHPTPRAALLSQLPLTVLMVAYTVTGLWLLSTPTVG